MYLTYVFACHVHHSLTNRVIAGMMLHQVRTNDTNCSDSKFNKIQKTCVGPHTLKPYGVDPVFKSGAGLYNPDFDDFGGNIVLNYYNCKQVGLICHVYLGVVCFTCF